MRGTKAKALRRLHGNPAIASRVYVVRVENNRTILNDGPRRRYLLAKKAYRTARRGGVL